MNKVAFYNELRTYENFTDRQIQIINVKAQRYDLPQTVANHSCQQKHLIDVQTRNEPTRREVRKNVSGFN